MTTGLDVRAPTSVVVSDSTLRASITSVHHVLKIQGYSSMMKSFPIGKALRSESFRGGGRTSWHIDFYPNGESRESGGFVSIHAVLDAAYLAVKADIGFDMLASTGELLPRYAKANSDVCNFRFVGAYWGYDKFTAREELKLLDCFSVRCNITVMEFIAGGAAPCPRPLLPVMPPPDWRRELLQSEQGADVRFIVGGETFAAHRCVLAARSPVFKAELFGAMKESSAAGIHIHGMRPEVFRNLLQFVYTEELPSVTQEEEDEAAMAQHLLVAADRYGMERLKLLCENRLCEHINVNTVVTTLVLAEQHGCPGLKESCFQFLLNSSSTTLEAVIATDDFDNVLSKSCPNLLKELMLRFASSDSLHGLQIIDRLEEEDDLALNTTQGGELPEPTHGVLPWGAGAPKRMRL
ncbi:unnamed protein product [Triticum turgidum subsp. durum]|uniref:BTB domain-containing protein n=1 Tax=Triticum turgidum subsp. durum TaxID=4567 RepID=A0A9R0WZQ0_TRITD|nr:unnamed protein product [Triticum turgidum subsp. durum]